MKASITALSKRIATVEETPGYGPWADLPGMLLAENYEWEQSHF